MEGQHALVLYHYPCTDGGFAAYAAWRANQQAARWASMTFIPYDHRQPAPVVADLPQADELYLLDCIGPSAEWLYECGERFAHVTVLDHHKTAYEVVNKHHTLALERPHAPSHIMAFVLSMQHSGCELALEHFQMHRYMSSETLNLFAYVEDNDIWQHKLKDSKAFTAGLSALRIDYDFREPKLAETVRVIESLKFDELVETGRRADLIEAYLKKAHHVHLATTNQIVGVEIAHEDWIITSELGERLAQLSPLKIGAVYNAGKVSLRSVEGVDTTAISKLHGGGGHAGASGFNFSSQQWEDAKRP